MAQRVPVVQERAAMPTTVPPALVHQITTLVSDVDAHLRTTLQEALGTLQEAGNVPGTILTISRLLEGCRGLLGHISVAHGQPLQGHALETQIDALRQQGLVPAPVASDLHWVRVRANPARHNNEPLPLTERDAVIALDFALGALAAQTWELEHRLVSQMRLQNLLEAWLYVHLPLSWAMLLAILSHIFVVFYHGYRVL